MKRHTLQCIPKLLLGLTQSKHDTRLCNDIIALEPLHFTQDRQTLPERRSAIAHIWRQGLSRLNIVCIHIEATLGHNLDHIQVATEITRQRLHQERRLLALYPANRLCEMPRAAVRQVIPVNARQHNVSQSPPCQRLGRVLRLVWVQRRRATVCLYGAEAASTCARVTHEHDGCGCGRGIGTTPAFANVGTAGFFADGVEAQTAQVGFDFAEIGVAAGRRDWGLEPFGEASDGAFAARRADFDGAQFVGFRGGEVGCIGVFGSDEGVEGGEGGVFEVCWAGTLGSGCRGDC